MPLSAASPPEKGSSSSCYWETASDTIALSQDDDSEASQREPSSPELLALLTQQQQQQQQPPAVNDQSSSSCNDDDDNDEFHSQSPQMETASTPIPQQQQHLKQSTAKRVNDNSPSFGSCFEEQNDRPLLLHSMSSNAADAVTFLSTTTSGSSPENKSMTHSSVTNSSPGSTIIMKNNDTVGDSSVVFMTQPPTNDSSDNNNDDDEDDNDCSSEITGGIKQQYQHESMTATKTTNATRALDDQFNETLDHGDEEIDVPSSRGETLSSAPNSAIKAKTPLRNDSTTLDIALSDNDDDDSSCTTSSSMSSNSSSSLKGEEYMAHVEANRQRNKQRLKLLGFVGTQSTPSPSAHQTLSAAATATCLDEGCCDDVVASPSSPTGMLLASTDNKATQRVSNGGNEPSITSSSSIDELYKQFPHRDFQIKTLVSLIGTAMGQAAADVRTRHEEKKNRNQNDDDPFVPPPIFVSGPSGSGKTSVVRSVVETLHRGYVSSQQQQNAAAATQQSGRRRCVALGMAYVNCAAIEPTTIEAVLEDAYNQLTPTETSSSKRRIMQGKGPRKKLKRNKDSDCGLPKSKHPKTENEIDTSDARQPLEDVGTCLHPNDGEYNSDMEAVIEDKLEALKAELRHANDDGDNADLRHTEEDEEENADSAAFLPTRRITRQSMNGTVDRKQQAQERGVPKSQGKSLRKVESVTASHGVPVAFGRAVSPFFGPPPPRSPETKPGCAVLVLDHAERLFSLSANQRAESNNFLAQLLLLPQVMRLNLTFVIVSRSTLLDFSRINNSASIQKSLGTIANGIHPVRVHFPAYKGKSVFKTILKRPTIVELIVGSQSHLFERNPNDPRHKLRLNTIDSFLGTLVQSLGSVTRDIREIIRIGRALWATYILPLDPRRIHSTLKTARRRVRSRRELKRTTGTVVDDIGTGDDDLEEVQKEILTILDEAILPRMKKCLEDDLFVLNGDTTHEATSTSHGLSAVGPYDLPYLSKCLLLAAFVCQSNKPDKDKALFTIQKNGTKNSRQGHRMGKNDSDGLAYGGSTTSEQHGLKMLRPRTFPLERMLSVFVNIVGLINGEEKLQTLSSRSNRDEPGELLRTIGSTCLFESLARLREIGLLHEVQGSSSVGGGDGSFTSFHGINMTSTKYWCELNRDEADALAASVEFPLENFLI